MKKKLFAFIFILLLLMPFISAQLIFRQESIVEISHPIRIDGAVDSSILANISVKDPENIFIASQQMTFNSNTDEHNITLNSGNSSKLGTYTYCISATNGTLYSTDCFEYSVTITGTSPSTAQGVIYFFLGLLSIALFGLSLFGAIKIKWDNHRNERGIIVGMNDLKYIKLLLWFMSYLLIIFITFAFRHVSYIADWDVAGNFLNGMFWFLIVFLFPVFVLTFLAGLMKAFDDKKLNNLISRGFKPK